MDELPTELLLSVLSLCDLTDLQSIALVCRGWHTLALELRKGLVCVNELEEQS